MTLSRRHILKSLLTVSSLSLLPKFVFADRPVAAFDAEGIAASVKALYGIENAENSDKVNLKAPDIAENGAVVPVTVSSDLADVTSISILVDGNPNPLVASFDISENGVADVSTRIKMGKTSNVIAVVQAGGKAYQTSQEVKVTIGGCGG